jgi:topoisomerase-4 subunit B
MSKSYRAEDIEVLTGLEPVKRRPGMYTDTARPNHLATEVIDNSVDEALAGHARRVDVTVYEDDSVEVTDDGRGMPVDIHPEQGMPGVELILTKLHAGGKFSDKNYQYAGGLHGVGVSVVNALSSKLEVWIKRDGCEHYMGFTDGDKTADLKEVGSVGQRNTGTRIRFWPNPVYFDSPNFSLKRLRHLLRAKAVLCPGLSVSLTLDKTGEREEWCYQEGLTDYLQSELEDCEKLPQQPFSGAMKGTDSEVSWALCWLPSGGLLQESYVNLIPTTQGGTHVNGLRTGLVEALREFCEHHSLLPRGVRLAPDDVWEKIGYILSVKLTDPQFSGQTKERLSSRACAAFVSGVVKDAFSLWLNQNVQDGEVIAQLAISSAQARMKSARKVVRKKVTSGPALPGKLADCTSQDLAMTELFLVEGDSAPGKSIRRRCSAIRKCMTSPWPSGSTRARTRSPDCATARSSFWPTPIRTGFTSPPCSRRCSSSTSPRWWKQATCSSRCRRCTASMSARKPFTHWMTRSAKAFTSASRPRAARARCWRPDSRASAK